MSSRSHDQNKMEKIKREEDFENLRLSAINLNKKRFLECNHKECNDYAVNTCAITFKKIEAILVFCPKHWDEIPSLPDMPDVKNGKSIIDNPKYVPWYFYDYETDNQI